MAGNGMSQNEPRLNKPPYALIFAPLIAGVVAAAVVYALYPSIPDPIPTHWDFTGTADSFSAKTPATVYGFVLWPAVFGVVLNLFVIGMIRVTAGDKPLASQASAEHNYERKIFGLNFQQKAIARFITLLTSLLIADMLLSITGYFSGPLLLALTVIAIVVPIIVLVRDLSYINEQIGKHYPNEYTKHLKWGMFYYNPEDERSFIEIDSSTTVNFASRDGKLFMLALLTPMIIVCAIGIIAGLR